LLLGHLQWFASLPSVLEVRQKQDLGLLNPLPFGIQALNCLGWVLYSIVLEDYFIFFTNITGVCLATFYSLTGLKLLQRRSHPADLRTAEYLEFIIIGGVFYYCLLGLVTGIAINDKEQIRLIIGISSVCFLIIYYSAPATSLMQVIRTQNSTSLHGPFLLANLAGGLMWTIYGFTALDDPIVYGSNGFGVIFTSVQLLIKLIYLPTSENDSLYEKGKNKEVVCGENEVEINARSEI
jgi:solute carrier family 50 (sugar transporter)